MTPVSIIIPAWNETKTLKATVQALLGIDYDKRKCEVIVVAGGDDDTYKIALELSPTMLGFSKYIVLLQRPEGKNAAIQQGIKEAANEIIVLLDADTLVSKGWLRSMTSPIELGRCDLTIANPEPVRRNWVSDYYMITKSYFLDSITTFSGHSMAFRGDIVRKRLEYFFDEDVKVGVDYLLAKRFSEQGKQVMFSKNASVVTYLPSSVKYFILTELRWLTALISIEGPNYRSLACNITVVGALILAVPVSKISFLYSVLFNSIYITKRAYLFLIASRQYKTSIRNIFGFVILSYIYHVIGLISHIKYFLGLSKGKYLCQGQRY